MEQMAMSIKEFAKEVGVGIQSMYRISKIDGFPLLKIGTKKRLVLVDPAKKWLLENWEKLDNAAVR